MVQLCLQMGICGLSLLRRAQAEIEVFNTNDPSYLDFLLRNSGLGLKA